MCCLLFWAVKSSSGDRNWPDTHGQASVVSRGTYKATL